MPFGADGVIVTDPTPFTETWRAMERLVGTGKARAIGVSNFSRSELQTILDEGSVVSQNSPT